jgi:hypothetical protein
MRHAINNHCVASGSSALTLRSHSRSRAAHEPGEFDADVISMILEHLVKFEPAFGDVRALSNLACVSKAFACVPWPESIVLNRARLVYEPISRATELAVRNAQKDVLKLAKEKPWWDVARFEIGLGLLKDACTALARELETEGHQVEANPSPPICLSEGYKDDEEGGEEDDEDSLDAINAAACRAANAQVQLLAETVAVPLSRTPGSAAERAFRACTLFCAACTSASEDGDRRWQLAPVSATDESLEQLLQLLPALRALVVSSRLPAEMRAVALLALGEVACLMEHRGRCSAALKLRAADEAAEVLRCLRVCFACCGATLTLWTSTNTDEVPARGVAAAIRAVTGSCARAMSSVCVTKRYSGDCKDALMSGFGLLCKLFVDKKAPVGERGRAAHAMTMLARLDKDMWEEETFRESGAYALANTMGNNEVFWHRSPPKRRAINCPPLDLHVEAVQLARAVKELLEDDELLEYENNTDAESCGFAGSDDEEF